jgi:hypothetical protein
LPGGPDEPGQTVLSRVIYVRANPGGGWVLGCQFVRELSDEELQRLLKLDAISSNQATLSLSASDASSTAPVSPSREIRVFPVPVLSVLFQVALESGLVVKWLVRQLRFKGVWPLPPGKVVTLRVGREPPGTPVEMAIKSCRQEGEYWIVDGTFTAPPSPELLNLFHQQVPPSPSKPVSDDTIPV